MKNAAFGMSTQNLAIELDVTKNREPPCAHFGVLVSAPLLSGAG
jgi:hypothetical protein